MDSERDSQSYPPSSNEKYRHYIEKIKAKSIIMSAFNPINQQGLGFLNGPVTLNSADFQSKPSAEVSSTTKNAVLDVKDVFEPLPPPVYPPPRTPLPKNKCQKTAADSANLFEFATPSSESPAWVEVYERGHLGDLSPPLKIGEISKEDLEFLLPGKKTMQGSSVKPWNEDSSGLPSFGLAAYLLLIRAPGGKMSSSVMRLMALEWLPCLAKHFKGQSFRAALTRNKCLQSEPLKSPKYWRVLEESEEKQTQNEGNTSPRSKKDDTDDSPPKKRKSGNNGRSNKPAKKVRTAPSPNGSSTPEAGNSSGPELVVSSSGTTPGSSGRSTPESGNSSGPELVVSSPVTSPASAPPHEEEVANAAHAFPGIENEPIHASAESYFDQSTLEAVSHLPPDTRECVLGLLLLKSGRDSSNPGTNLAPSMQVPPPSKRQQKPSQEIQKADGGAEFIADEPKLENPVTGKIESAAEIYERRLLSNKTYVSPSSKSAAAPGAIVQFINGELVEENSDTGKMETSAEIWKRDFPGTKVFSSPYGVPPIAPGGPQPHEGASR